MDEGEARWGSGKRGDDGGGDDDDDGSDDGDDEAGGNGDWATWFSLRRAF